MMTTTADKSYSITKCSTSSNPQQRWKTTMAIQPQCKNAKGRTISLQKNGFGQNQRRSSNTIKRCCEMTQSRKNDSINAPTSQAHPRRAPGTNQPFHARASRQSVYSISPRNRRWVQRFVGAERPPNKRSCNKKLQWFRSLTVMKRYPFKWKRENLAGETSNHYFLR